jgi:hypothetical protein
MDGGAGSVRPRLVDVRRSGVLVSSDSHITIEMIDTVRSPMVRRVVRVISCLVVVAAVGLALTAEAWELVQSQDKLKSPAMRMPMSWLYAISMIGFSLFKAECIRNPAMRPKGGWKSVGDVEIAVAEYVDWFNHRRLHGEIGLVPPAEFETDHWASTEPEHYPETPVLTGVGSK